MASANEPAFDPYLKWLGIPKHQRPPTYYQLLGLERGESDPQVIEEAAVRRTTHLRAYQVGPQAALCTKLINEIGRAQQVLLNPQKKSEYDRRLPHQVAPATQAAENPFELMTSKEPPSPIRPGKPRKAPRDESPRTPRRSIEKAPSSQSIVLVVCAIVAGIASLGFVAGIAFWMLARSRAVDQQEQAAVAMADLQADIARPKELVQPFVKPIAKPIEPLAKLAPRLPDNGKLEPMPAPGIVPPAPMPEDAQAPPAVAQKDALPPEPMKADPPPADKIRETLKAIQSQFAKEYIAAKKSAVERAALADKLLKLAQETTDDVAGRYVLFAEARDLACQAGKWSLASEALDALAGEFAVDAISQRELAMQMLINSPLPKAAAEEAARTALASAHECVAIDRIESVQKFVALGNSAAAKTQNAALIAQFKKHDQEVKALAREYERMSKARTVLDDMPDDAAANLAVGRYLALFKGDWEGGLSHLAKAGDGALQEAARKDGENPQDAKMQHDVGNLWWNLAEKDSGWPRAALLGRAGFWYRQAAAKSIGLTLATLTGRIKSIDEATSLSRPLESRFDLTEAKRFQGHTAAITSLWVAPDGKRFYSGSLDGSIRIWDIAGGAQRDALDAQAPVLSFSFSPSEGFLAAVGKDRLRIWNMETRLSIKLPDEVVTPGGFWGGADQFFFTAETGQYDYIDCPRLKGFRANFPVPGARLSGAHGRPLGITLGKDVRLFRPVVGGGIQPVQKVSVPDATCAAFSLDGRWLLVGSSDKRIRKFDVAAMKLVETFAVPSAAPDVLAFSPDNRRFLCAGSDKIVRLWDLDSRKEIGRSAKHQSAIQAVAFTGDGQQAFSAGDDTIVRLWHLPRERK